MRRAQAFSYQLNTQAGRDGWSNLGMYAKCQGWLRVWTPVTGQRPSSRHSGAGRSTGTELIKITWRTLCEANEGLGFRLHSGLLGGKVRSAKFYYRHYGRFEAAMCWVMKKHETHLHLTCTAARASAKALNPKEHWGESLKTDHRSLPELCYLLHTLLEI